MQNIALLIIGMTMILDELIEKILMSNYNAGRKKILREFIGELLLARTDEVEKLQEDIIKINKRLVDVETRLGTYI